MTRASRSPTPALPANAFESISASSCSSSRSVPSSQPCIGQTALRQQRLEERPAVPSRLLRLAHVILGDEALGEGEDVVVHFTILSVFYGRPVQSPRSTTRRGLAPACRLKLKVPASQLFCDVGDGHDRAPVPHLRATHLLLGARSSRKTALSPALPRASG